MIRNDKVHGPSTNRCRFERVVEKSGKVYRVKIRDDFY